MERQVRVALDGAPISQVTKAKLRLQLDSAGKIIQKRQKDAEKAQSEQLFKKLSEVVSDRNCSVLVSDVPTGEADARSLINVAQYLCEKRKIAVFLFLRESDAFSGCACVPEALASKLKANDWVDSLKIGKGGGRPAQASVRGPLASLEEAMTKARQVAQTADGTWVVV